MQPKDPVPTAMAQHQTAIPKRPNCYTLVPSVSKQRSQFDMRTTSSQHKCCTILLATAHDVPHSSSSVQSTRRVANSNSLITSSLVTSYPRPYHFLPPQSRSTPRVVSNNPFLFNITISSPVQAPTRITSLLFSPEHSQIC